MRIEVANLGFVTQSPHESVRCGIRLSFLSELRDPLIALGVAHAILGRVTAFFLLDESYLSNVRLHLLAARAEQEIATLNVRRFAPEHRCARILFFAVFLILFVLSGC